MPDGGWRRLVCFCRYWLAGELQSITFEIRYFFLGWHQENGKESNVGIQLKTNLWIRSVRIRPAASAAATAVQSRGRGFRSYATVAVALAAVSSRSVEPTGEGARSKRSTISQKFGLLLMDYGVEESPSSPHFLLWVAIRESVCQAAPSGEQCNQPPQTGTCQGPLLSSQVIRNPLVWGGDKAPTALQVIKSLGYHSLARLSVRGFPSFSTFRRALERVLGFRWPLVIGHRGRIVYGRTG
ncbi:hypothetical protein QBC37DRAFT_403772 [Rhypophila decipiens]|uniref:Uncharacterized protein n=1 Tax=Rhypophila decipiens TaxID=261697 RepID=A0AAN7B3Y9_9PEZI|nr:hypothetical protein QBC37DRAFT_403772 [Rhypophila decipiens]